MTFDTYGTLIDWETGIWEALQPLRSRLADPPAREEALAAFAQAESACQEAAPGMLYADILTATHRTLSGDWGVEPDDAGSVRFGRSVGGWPAFEDSADSLAYLKNHHRLVTLTNCDRRRRRRRRLPPTSGSRAWGNWWSGTGPSEAEPGSHCGLWSSGGFTRPSGQAPKQRAVEPDRSVCAGSGSRSERAHRLSYQPFQLPSS